MIIRGYYIIKHFTEKDSREYTLSKNILFVWAGIHTEQDTSH